MEFTCDWVGQSAYNAVGIVDQSNYTSLYQYYYNSYPIEITINNKAVEKDIMEVLGVNETIKRARSHMRNLILQARQPEG